MARAHVPGRDADVDSPRSDFPEDVHVGHAPEFDADVRLFGEEDRQCRQQDVSGCFIPADSQNRAASLRKLPNRCRRFVGHSEQPDRLRQKGIPCLRQRGVLRAAIEQTLTQILFKAADGLAHRRLGSTEFDRGQREAVFGGDRDEGLEFSELHRSLKSKGAITLVG